MEFLMKKEIAFYGFTV